MCPRCQEFYEKYPLEYDEDDKKHYHKISEDTQISPIGCAFEWYYFNPDNWNCETMNKLLEMADYTDRNGDNSIGIIRLPEKIFRIYSHLILLWYKNRGRISNAYMVGEGQEIGVLTVDIAERILENVTKN